MVGRWLRQERPQAPRARPKAKMLSTARSGSVPPEPCLACEGMFACENMQKQKKNKGVEAPRGRLVKSCQLVKESLIEKSSKDPIGEGTDPKP